MIHTISKSNLEVIKNRYFFTKKFLKNKKILEIGCGFGIGFSYLYESCKEYLGIDNNSTQIDLAKRRHKDHSSKFKNLELSQLKDIDQKFDVILCLATVYYLDINNFLEISKKLLNDDGQIIFDTSNKNIPGFDSSWDNQSNYYQVFELNNILNNHGFESQFYGAFYIDNIHKVEKTQKIRTFIKKIFNLLHLDFIKKMIVFFTDKKFHILPHSIQTIMKNYNYNFQSISPTQKCHDYKVIFITSKLRK